MLLCQQCFAMIQINSIKNVKKTFNGSVLQKWFEKCTFYIHQVEQESVQTSQQQLQTQQRSLDQRISDNLQKDGAVI